MAGVRAIWAIQDSIALTREEAEAIQLKRETVSGQERTIWNPALSIPVKEFEFSDGEAARIKAAIEGWSSYGAAPDRSWFEPLVQAFFPSGPG